MRELRAVAAARELGAREAMCTQLVEKVSVAGHCDVVYISELGCGINRGAMNFGRLYQVSFLVFQPQKIIVVGSVLALLKNFPSTVINDGNKQTLLSSQDYNHLKVFPKSPIAFIVVYFSVHFRGKAKI